MLLISKVMNSIQINMLYSIFKLTAFLKSVTSSVQQVALQFYVLFFLHSVGDQHISIVDTKRQDLTFLFSNLLLKV